MSKLDATKEILCLLNVPERQRNSMCCYVLLAMANLRACSEFSVKKGFL